MARLLVLSMTIAVLAFAAACGGGGDDGPTATPAAGDSTPGALREVDDLGYLDVFCGGVARYFDVVQTATTVDEIAEAVAVFVSEMEAVVPPEDVRPFHQAFIDYLRASADDPTSLLVEPPPVPDEDVRERLAGKESQVDSCKESNFFSSRDPDATSTPGF